LKKTLAARGPKNFYDSGSWAFAPPQPMAQIKKSLLLLFFRKEVLALL
jgi:hypothetical protein